MFTGSEKDLANRIFKELEKLLPDDSTKEIALPRVRERSNAVAKALFNWWIANGKNAIRFQVVGQGQHIIPPGSFAKTDSQVPPAPTIPSLHPPVPYVVKTSVRGQENLPTIEIT